MKSRVILFSVLVFVIALAGCAPAAAPQQSSSQPVAAGENVSAAKTRLFSDAQKTNLAYEIENDRVYQGTVSQGEAVLYFDGNTIFRGPNNNGEKLFTVDGNSIFAGAQAGGNPVWTIQNGRVHEGRGNGPTVYTIEGDRMFQGATTDPSNIVFAANANLAGNVQFLLPVLAEQRY
jgi:hypothetical protein